MIRFIEVKDQDITMGDRCCSDSCAIALALRHEYDPTRREDYQIDIEVALEDEDVVDVVIGAELKGEDMTDIPSGAWEQEPPTDKQLKTFNDKVAQATDDGQTELVKKAKDFLASGNATKKNIFDWIDTEGDWTLKDGS